MCRDSELYNRFLSGDKTAYDELMIRYGDSLTNYLNGYLHNPEDAEDLMIDTFARIMVKRPQIGEGNFKAYLYKVGRNLVTRFHLRRSRADVFSLDDIEEISYETDYGEDVSSKERAAVIRRCLAKIEPEYREALWLVYMENMSYEKAAEIMKVNYKRMDYMLQRGKQRLRAELEKEGITNPDD